MNDLNELINLQRDLYLRQHDIFTACGLGLTLLYACKELCPVFIFFTKEIYKTWKERKR